MLAGGQISFPWVNQVNPIFLPHTCIFDGKRKVFEHFQTRRQGLRVKSDSPSEEFYICINAIHEVAEFCKYLRLRDVAVVQGGGLLEEGGLGIQ